ncbi:MAG: four helix bundle protein [Candidatus Dadabacteria bacterium]
MFLQLAHTKTDVYQSSKKLVLEVYIVTRDFPNEEKFALVQQIRRAAIPVHLNIAEGCSRKSEAERKRYFEVSRGSVIEVDTAIGIAHDLNYKSLDQLQSLGDLIVNSFKQLSGLIGKGISV